MYKREDYNLGDFMKVATALMSHLNVTNENDVQRRTTFIN